MSELRGLGWLWVVVLSFATGCGQDAEDPASVGVQSSALRSGRELEPGEWPAVVKIPQCTATLITPNHILTASHCYFTWGNVLTDLGPRESWGGWTGPTATVERWECFRRELLEPGATWPCENTCEELVDGRCEHVDSGGSGDVANSRG